MWYKKTLPWFYFMIMHAQRALIEVSWLAQLGEH